MKHICLIAEHFPNRSETFIWNHAVGLAEKGHQVTVISEGKGNDIGKEELQELAELGIKRICISAPRGRKRGVISLFNLLIRDPGFLKICLKCRPWPLGDIVARRRMFQVLSKIRPDIVHVHYGRLSAQLLKASGKSQFEIPLITTWHGYDANAVPKKFGEDIYAELFSSNSFHTVGSSFMRQRLLSLGADSKDLELIPMGINLDRFKYRKRKLAGHETLRLISVGRLDEMKGHDYLIRAVTKLLDEGLNLSLRIIGDGILKRQLEKQIVSSGHHDRICLLGGLPPQCVSDELEDSHLFVLSGVVAKSGRVETQGVVFAEAQACGLPVIASSVGGVAESLEEGKSGLLCSPGNVAELKAAIQFFYFDRDKIAQFGNEGRKLVEQKFSIEQMLIRFDSLYENF